MSDVLKNESEVKLHRNALSVLEYPTGNEVDDDNNFNTSSGSDIGEHDFYKGSEFHKINKPRVRSTRLWYHVKVIKIKHKKEARILNNLYIMSA